MINRLNIYSNSLILSFLYFISVSAYFKPDLGFFYEIRPILYILITVIVVYDIFRRKYTIRNIDRTSLSIIVIFLLIQFVSIFYSYSHIISIQLFITNMLLISVSIIYILNINKTDINNFFIYVLTINTFIYLISLFLFIFNYHLVTTTRFGLITFTGIFMGKQIGILSLLTIFSIDIIKKFNHKPNILQLKIMNYIYILSVVFILLSFSRAIFLALLVYWGMKMSFEQTFNRKLLLYILLLAFIVTIFIFKPFNDQIKYLVSDREYFINYASHIYKSYILKGNGYGCGKFLTSLPIAEKYIRSDLMGKQFHNSYLEIFFDTGIFGLLSYIAIFIIFYIKSTIKKMYVILSMVTAFLIYNLFSSSLAYPSSLSYFFTFFLILFGIFKPDKRLDNYNNDSENRRENRHEFTNL
ncbi:hypothetical protein KAU43_01735 [candidate division WOR-3 bacterium]|nr:hypothetical protein [candidate division WOR-3 bacterium]